MAQPYVDAGTIFDDEPSLAQYRDILRRRLVILGRRTDGHEVLHLHAIAADALHERIQRRKRGYNMDSVTLSPHRVTLRGNRVTLSLSKRGRACRGLLRAPRDQ
jgi:hypothetical protein